MKALTLWQPWASLVAVGAKTIETRSWSTSYRGPLAIHAGARRPRDVPAERIVGGGYGLRAIGRTGWAMEGPGLPAFRSTPRLEGYVLPLGAVVATCTLADVVPILADIPYDGSLVLHSTDGALTLCGRLPTGDPYAPRWSERLVSGQRPFGDFTPGRFAWLLADVEPLAEPIPARGRQQLWEWAAPASV